MYITETVCVVFASILYVNVELMYVFLIPAERLLPLAHRVSGFGGPGPAS